MSWTKVCKKDMMIPDTGLCVKGSQGEHIAVFLERATDKLYAISNQCPFANASVLSRGLLASLGGKITVASPVYKQHFNLETGACLEDESVTLKTYDVREVDGVVEVMA